MSKLLVIDDDRTVLHMISQAFRDSPVSVLTAQTAEQGLALIAERPDVVLLDIVLREGSGLDVVHQIRQRDAKLPVIFITGRGSSETAIEAMKLGAYDYLLKPLHLPKLRELVRPRPQNQGLDASSSRSGEWRVLRADGRRTDWSQPADAGGIQGDRPRRSARCHSAHPRRKRHRQGTGRRGRSITIAVAPTSIFWL